MSIGVGSAGIGSVGISGVFESHSVGNSTTVLLSLIPSLSEAKLSTVSSVTQLDLIPSTSTSYLAITGESSTTCLTLIPEGSQSILSASSSTSRLELTPSISNCQLLSPTSVTYLELTPSVSEGVTSRYKIDHEQGGPGHLPGDLLIAWKGDYLADGSLKTIYDIEASVTEIPEEGKAIINLENAIEKFEEFEKHAYGMKFIVVGSTDPEKPERQNFWERKSVGETLPYDALFTKINSRQAYKDRYKLSEPHIVYYAGGLHRIPDLVEVTGLDSNVPGMIMRGNIYVEGKFKVTGGQAREELDEMKIDISRNYDDIAQISPELADKLNRGQVPPSLIDVPTLKDALVDEVIIVGGVIAAPYLTADNIAVGTLKGVSVESSTSSNRVVLSSGDALEFYYNGGVWGSLTVAYSGSGTIPDGIRVNGGLHAYNGVRTNELLTERIEMLGDIDMRTSAISFNGIPVSAYNNTGIHIGGDLHAAEGGFLREVTALDFKFITGDKVSEVFLTKTGGFTGIHNGMSYENGKAIGVV